MIFGKKSLVLVLSIYWRDYNIDYLLLKKKIGFTTRHYIVRRGEETLGKTRNTKTFLRKIKNK